MLTYTFYQIISTLNPYFLQYKEYCTIFQYLITSVSECILANKCVIYFFWRLPYTLVPSICKYYIHCFECWTSISWSKIKFTSGWRKYSFFINWTTAYCTPLGLHPRAFYSLWNFCPVESVVRVDGRFFYSAKS